ncbi:MAG: PAS domain S-box protein [Promethearchaeota archaeon]
MCAFEKINHELYESVIDNLDDPLHVINNDFELILINKAMKKWLTELGLSNTLLGQSLFKAFTFLSEKVIEEYKYVQKEGKSLIKSETISISNQNIIAEIQKTPIIKDGKVHQIITIVRDITTREIARKKVKESEEKFRLLTEQSFLGIAILQDDYIKYVNDKLASIFGYTIEEIMKWGKGGFLNVIHPQDRIMVAKQAKKKQAGNLDATNQYQFRGIRKDAEIIFLEVFSKSIDYKGKPADFVTILDITEQKQAQRQLKDSELIFRDLYEEAPNAYFSIDTNKLIIRTNKAAERLLGYTKEELLNMIVFDLYAETKHGLKKAKDLFQRFLKGENIKDEELQMKTKKGDLIWVSLTVKPMFDETGKVIESRSMVLDINDRKLAQKELENSYKRLRELEYIVNNSPGVVFLWKNSEGWPVEFVSENISHFGYTPEDFYSGNVIYSEIIHPDDLKRVAQEVEIYSNEDIEEFEQEYRILAKHGDARWIDDRTWIRRDSEGNITHFQGIVLDITDRKIAEEALKLSEKKYKEAFDRANFYKDLFAHDINNILQVVNSSAELISFHLGESDKSKDIKSVSDIIKKQVERGSKLVSNVRTLSDLEEKEISTENTIVYDLLKKSIEYVKKAYTNREVNILVDSIDKKIIVKANELLQDVFENILINGIKYNEHSKVDILVKISHQKFNEIKYLKIEFIDNGIGIHNDRKEIIFKPGNRELKGSKGMGLGLSLVSKILSIFNGKVWVEDRIKGDYTKGSNFVLLLPKHN